MQRIWFSAVAVAIGLVAAPRAQAQSADQVRCRDGSIVVASRGSRSCEGHGGLVTYGRGAGRDAGRGVYDGRGTNGTAGTAGTRGVYRGGVNNGGVYNGRVSNEGATDQLQCADGTISTVGSYGCARHGGVSRNGRDDRNGPWYERGRSNGRWEGRRGDDRDDDEDDDRDDDRDDDHGGRWKKHHKEHRDNGRRRHGHDHDDHDDHDDR